MLPNEPKTPTKNAFKLVADPSSLSKEEKLRSPAYKTHYPRPLQQDDRAARAAAANAQLEAEKTSFFRLFTPLKKSNTPLKKKFEPTEATVAAAEKTFETAVGHATPKVRGSGLRGDDVTDEFAEQAEDEMTTMRMEYLRALTRWVAGTSS
jgi:hypothetical protein